MLVVWVFKVVLVVFLVVSYLFHEILRLWNDIFRVFSVFCKALGSDAPDAPLLLISLGPQSDALENLQVPKNALCLPVMPQVDLLKSGVDLFLTHGGQNSFMESLL